MMGPVVRTCSMSRLRHRNRVGLLAFALVICLAGYSRAFDGFSAGPLICDFPLTLTLGHRTEMLGPLFYSEEKDTQKTWAVPPLVAHVTDSGTDSEEFDIAYPLLTLDRFGTEYRWH